MGRDKFAEYDASPIPSEDEQAKFWDQWNGQWRFGAALDPFQTRQRDAALAAAQSNGLENARILDVGCGTGWLGASLQRFGSVTGADLSPRSIELGRQRYPGIELMAGDFLTLPFRGPFDLVVCADAMVNIHDPPAAIAKIAGLLRPGGVFLLMTPNRWVWLHRSGLHRIGPGQFMRWPSLGTMKGWIRPHFKIERIGSIEPGGDQGILWWVENRYVRGIARRLIGGDRWRNALEGLRLGRQWVVVARRAS